MDRTSVQSRAILSVGYDEDLLVLEIEFVQGGVYQYSDVPAPVYDELMAAQSKGKYFAGFIRNVYPGEQVR